MVLFVGGFYLCINKILHIQSKKEPAKVEVPLVEDRLTYFSLHIHELKKQSPQLERSVFF
jgi:hypothetical protein